MTAFPCPHCGTIIHSGDNASPEGFVVTAVATAIGVSASEIRGHDRTRHLAHARHVAMYILRADYHRSYPEIARAFGHRDHTGAMHAYRKIADQAQRCAEVRGVLAAIRAAIAEQQRAA